MTNEEAIKIFKEIKAECESKQTELGKQVFEYTGLEALDLAIKALEQQPKTGHWIAMSEGFTPYECSECESVEFKKSNFCPNCGAKMADGGGES